MGAGLQHTLGMCGELHRYRDVGVTVLSPGRSAEGGGKGVKCSSWVSILPELQSFPMTQADTKLW